MTSSDTHQMAMLARIFFSTLLLATPVQGMAAKPLRISRMDVNGSLGVTTSSDSRHKELFQSFLHAYGRTYLQGTKESEERFTIFTKRLADIELFNARPNRRWTAGVNNLADRTEEELAGLRGYKGVAPSGARRAGSLKVQLEESRERRVRLPESLSYEDSENSWIRDQGACGSCWAVTASTVLGFHSEIHNSENLRAFSTQEIVDCVPNPNHCGGSGGCEGSTVELAMQYVMLRGLGVPEDTPYEAYTHKCKELVADSELEALTDFPTDGFHQAPSNAPGRSFGMVGWERLPTNAYLPLITALVELGPVAVSMAASSLSFYESGLFDCQDFYGGGYDFEINHAVTLIGFGTDESRGEGYYLVQNSWGPAWGEKGRVRVLRQENEQSHCGVDNKPQDGVGCDGGPQSVVVCGTCGLLFDSVVPHFER